MRRPQTVDQLLAQIGPGSAADLRAVIDAFRAEGAGFVLPPASELVRHERDKLFHPMHLINASTSIRCHFIFRDISGSSIIRILGEPPATMLVQKSNSRCLSPDESM